MSAVTGRDSKSPRSQRRDLWHPARFLRVVREIAPEMGCFSMRAGRGSALCALAVVALDVAIEDLLELGYDGVAAEGGGEFAVDVDGGFGLLEGAGEADAQVGVLGFAGTVDDAAHDRYLEFLDAGILLAPLGHGGAQVGLDLLGQFLEIGTGGAAAARATGDLGHEAANSQRLQNLLRG